MFDNQIQRVKDNILPFTYIGLFIGVVIGKASWFRKIGWLNDYFRFSKIDTHYPDSGQIIFFNHFDPDTLTFLLIALFAFSAFYRIVFGTHERDSGNSRSINQTIENFGSLLAIAWLGLIAGIMLPTLIYEGIASCITFLVYAVYPLLFLIEVKICTAFLSGNSLYKLQVHFARFTRWKLGVRIEGLVILGLATLMLAYQDKYSATLESFTLWAKSII